MDALGTFAGWKQEFSSPDIQADIPSVNVSQVKNKLSNFDMTFEAFTNPNLDFELWFLKFASISDLLFLLDFAFRTYFTVRMCFRFWDAGSISLPEVDIVRSTKPIRNPLKMTNGRLLTHLFANPFIGLMLLMLLGSWLVSMVSSVYLPLYEEYNNGCVPANGNGTFFTDNLFSSAYNFAYQEGSSLIVERLEDFDTMRTEACTSMYTQSTIEERENEILLASFKSSLNISRGKMEEMLNCISEDIDIHFQQACCGYDGYPNCNPEVKSDVVVACSFHDKVIPSKPYQPPGE